MTRSSSNRQDAESYRVYLLRLWRDGNGPWHASLQAADAAAPHRFADLEALFAFVRDLVLPATATSPPAVPAATAAGMATPEADGS